MAKSHEEYLIPPNFNGKHAECFQAHSMPDVIVSLLEFLPEDLLISVGTDMLRFWEDFVKETSKCQSNHVNDYVKACKKRYKLFRSACSLVLTHLSPDHDVFMCNKDGEMFTLEFNPPADRCLLAITAMGEVAFTDFISQCHPRSYRWLYDGLKEIILYFQYTEDILLDTKRNIVSCYMVLAQSLGQAYELINTPIESIIEKQQEWLKIITSESKQLDPELDLVIDEVFQDLLEGKKNYIRDLTSLRRSLNNFLKSRRWNVEEFASRAVTSSASKEKLVKNMPNQHILMAMYEKDPWDFPGDQLIGYYSNYPVDEDRKDDLIPFRATWIPKTSYGYRPINLAKGPIRDRMEYFATGIQNQLKFIASDCTKQQDEGATWVAETTAKGIYWSISMDLESATDYVYHTYLRKIWTLLLGEDISDYLLQLTTGRTLVEIFDEKTHKKKTLEIDQTRGIKQGVPGVFELGLTLGHHIIYRCVMKRLHLEDMLPQDFYRVLGDDSHARLKRDGLNFVSIYTHLMTLAGFKVHDLKEKGHLTAPASDESLGEFSKKTYLNGSIISPIPYKLFFKKCNLESEVARHDWLDQYACWKPYMTNMARDIIWRHQDVPFIEEILYVFSKHKISNIKPKKFVSVSKDLEIEILYSYCFNALQHSLVCHVLDPKNRLSSEDKLLKFDFFKQCNMSDIISKLTDYAYSHGVEMTTLDFVNAKNSFVLERARDLLSGTQLENYILVNPFDELQTEQFINTCAILSDLQISRTIFDDDKIIDTLIQGKKFISSIRPHDIVGIYAHNSSLIEKTSLRLLSVQTSNES